MNSYDDLLKREGERELEDLKRRNAAKQRFESAAKQAHTIRAAGHLLLSSPVPSWEEMDLSSQRHLIADAENVASNISISHAQLNKLYQERLAASGDTDHPDLKFHEERFHTIEEGVLKDLKATLSNFPPTSSAVPNPSETDA